jgi:hypothetical protein
MTYHLIDRVDLLLVSLDKIKSEIEERRFRAGQLRDELRATLDEIKARAAEQQTLEREVYSAKLLRDMAAESPCWNAPVVNPDNPKTDL